MSELEQCATIELAVRQQRQLVEQYKDAWRHVLRQALAQRLAQALTRQRARIRHHVRFESLGLCSHQHDAGAHAWMQTDRSLDFRRLDPEPAYLHLLVRASDVLQHSIRGPSCEVTGSVKSRAARS